MPWLWDSLYGDDLVEPEAPPTRERSLFPRILTVEPTPPSSTAEPLLIELQGDHYVRLRDQDNSTETLRDASTGSPAPTVASAPPNPAVLIFRDGSREEVSGYTISGGTLYAQSDFYASGAWHQKIELSALDVPATIAQNQSRGVRFQLPKAPNEVIVGP